MINTFKLYQDYVVFVECKSLRGRSKAESSAPGGAALSRFQSD
jgi:hypothetical protein